MNKPLPAFPSNAETDCTGMSLRDYFAAQAMQAMIANPRFDEDARAAGVAKAAYFVADAMLEARK